jgi:DNA-binding IclR family transcriptional regulator
MAKAPNYSVPALEKGLDVLELLAAVAVPQSLAELAVRLDRSSSELFRMLNCLEKRDYISRDPLAGKYALTLKLFTLAHSHSVVEKLLQAARQPMREVTETMRESCHLSVLDRGRLLVIAQEDSPEPVRLSIEVGAVFDAPRTASGRLLLAHLSDDALADALSSSSAAAEFSAAARKQFDRSLAELRSSKVSTADSETIDGVRDVAVLVGAPQAGVTAALATTRLVRHGRPANDTALVTALRKAAASITRSLGLTP